MMSFEWLSFKLELNCFLEKLSCIHWWYSPVTDWKATWLFRIAAKCNWCIENFDLGIFWNDSIAPSLYHLNYFIQTTHNILSVGKYLTTAYIWLSNVFRNITLMLKIVPTHFWHIQAAKETTFRIQYVSVLIKCNKHKHILHIYRIRTIARCT